MSFASICWKCRRDRLSTECRALGLPGNRGMCRRACRWAWAWAGLLSAERLRWMAGLPRAGSWGKGSVSMELEENTYDANLLKWAGLGKECWGCGLSSSNWKRPIRVEEKRDQAGKTTAGGVCVRMCLLKKTSLKTFTTVWVCIPTPSRMCLLFWVHRGKQTQKMQTNTREHTR